MVGENDVFYSKTNPYRGYTRIRFPSFDNGFFLFYIPTFAILDFKRNKKKLSRGFQLYTYNISFRYYPMNYISFYLRVDRYFCNSVRYTHILLCIQL